jgi:hypothetical protein
MKGVEMKSNRYWFVLFASMMIIVLAACGINATAAPTATIEPTTIIVPTSTIEIIPTIAPTATTAPTQTAIPILVSDKVASPSYTLQDSDSSIVWWEKRTITGDDRYKGQLERPFTSEEMVYQPDIDILKASIASDDKFYYFTLTMQGLDKTTKTLTGTYGIEFDRTKTGRGDLLVRAHDLKKVWSFINVKAYSDPDGDIGGPNPGLANDNYEGNGYESEIKLEGDKVAYARILPGNSKAVQIAVSLKLLDGAKEFLWNGWADKGVNDPGKYDYIDHFTEREAGSPIITKETYPLADLYSVDNTCRKPYGFGPAEYIPGMCLIASPMAQTGPSGSSEGCTLVCSHYNPNNGSCDTWSCR